MFSVLAYLLPFLKYFKFMKKNFDFWTDSNFILLLTSDWIELRLIEFH